MNRGLRIKLYPFLGTLAMVVCLMSGYSVFYGKVRSPMWYLLYFGKYILVLAFIVLAYSKKSKYQDARSAMKWLQKLFLIIPIACFIYTLGIWTVNGTTVPFITRGISDTLFKMIAFAGGISFAFLLGSESVRCGFYATIITYSISIVLGFIHGGFGFLSSSLFQRTTTAQGLYTELHEVAYIMGLLLVYMLFVNRKDISKSRLAFFMLCFFFVIAWKRIGIAAILIVFIIGIITKRAKKMAKDGIMRIAGIIGVIVCLFYISLTASNELVQLLTSRGIGLMGRNIIYNYFRQFCDFSITFLGRGVGFVGRQFDYTSAADLYNMAAIRALHNDFMKLFIELGFWGFTIWCIMWLIRIPKKIMNKYSIDTAYSIFLLIIYSFITYTTDNTEGYFNYQMYLTMLISVIVITFLNQKKQVD